MKAPPEFWMTLQILIAGVVVCVVFLCMANDLTDGTEIKGSLYSGVALALQAGAVWVAARLKGGK